MIFKCSSCEHVFQQSDPAYGWEDGHYVEACPNCRISLRSPLTEIRLINGLAVAQFLALTAAASNVFFNQYGTAQFYTCILIAVTLAMFVRNDKKGQPVLLRPKK
jgi:hypothetical protein